jgi:peptidyl-prolyl cis-trans isomerase SurA
MALSVRISFLALGLLAMPALAGCLSADKQRLLDGFDRDPVKDLDKGETPRVARSQNPGSVPPPPPVGAPPPVQASQPPNPPASVAPPPPLPPVQPPAGTASAAQPPAAPPPAIQPVASKIVAPEPGLPAQPAFRVAVAAWVNGKPIFSEEVSQAIQPSLHGMTQREAQRRIPELFDKALESIIDQELLYQDAVNKLEKFNPKGYKKLCEIQKQEFQKKLTEILIKNHISEEQFVEGLRRAGMTLEQRENIERRNFFADEYLRSRVIPLMQRGTSHWLLKEYYDNHASEFQQLDSVEWQDIFIAHPTRRNPTREHAYRFAAEIANRLRNGDDLARLVEFDDGDSKSRGGQGLGHHPNDVEPPQLARFLFGMREGEVGPIVEIETGFHIIRVSRREFAGPIPFNEQTQKLIARKLRNDIVERERRRVIHELRSRAVIIKNSQL